MTMRRENYVFIKTDMGWFIDLPEYVQEGGNEADLAMILGADIFLELLDNKKAGRVEIKLSIERFDDCDALFREDSILTASGKYYSHTEDLFMWLCDVTKYVFNGEFPSVIYFKKIE